MRSLLNAICTVLLLGALSGVGLLSWDLFLTNYLTARTENDCIAAGYQNGRVTRLSTFDRFEQWCVTDKGEHLRMFLAIHNQRRKR